jgi:SAM-dependent methyltransferase
LTEESSGADAAAIHRLGAGFDTGAAGYAAHRPGYPDEAVAWLAGPDARDVLDLGAGSGSLTAALASAGHRVVAAEPSRAMLAELVSRGLKGLPVVQAAAEALPFAAGSFNLVTVATAFHWFDASSALPQIASVLRTGGRLGLVWNSRTESGGWPETLGELLRGAQPPELVGDWGTGSVAAVEGSPLFGPLDEAGFAFTQRLDRDGLVGLAASRSYVIALPDARRRRLLEHVGRLFDSAADADSTVELPYLARCWRCTRV